MPFQKGHAPMGGRPKGVTSKRLLVREIIEKCLGRTLPEDLLDMANKNPKLAMDIKIALLPYCHPKLQSIEVRADIDATLDTSEQVNQLIEELKALKQL